MSDRPPSGNDKPLNAIRLIQEQVKSASELHAVRIQEHDKRMNVLVRQVEEGSKVFGVQMKLGVVIGLSILFVALFFSISPIVRGVVEEAAGRINWDERMRAAADAKLKERLTADVLAKAVDNNAIQKAASSVADSPEFKAMIRRAAEDAAREAVTSNISRIIADTNNFRAVIDEQLRAERDRLQAATATLITISADNREELATKLLATVSSYKKLGSEWTRIEIYPFDNDSFHLRGRINWRLEARETERARINELSFQNVAATNDQVRSAITRYLQQSSLPASIGMMPSRSPNGKRYLAGSFHQDAESMSSDYDAAAGLLVENSIALVDDCFGLKFPTTWRIQVHLNF